MCILFTCQLTQAACGDKYDSNKYVDKMQKKKKEREKRTNLALQSTLGKLIGKLGGDSLRYSAVNFVVQKGRYDSG